MIGVAVASALGAVARLLVDRAVSRRFATAWPAGTLVVNISGSLALGVLAGLGLAHSVAPGVRATVGTGFIGTYTTLSAFAFETTALAQQGDGATARRYLVVSVAGGIAAAGLGLSIGTRL